MRRQLMMAAAVSVLFWCAGAFGQVVIETVTVGDAGNTADDEIMSTDYTTGYGGVAYVYSIGVYEVTNSQYAEFLNAVATVGDLHYLYNTDMGGGSLDVGGISRTGSGTEGDPWVYTARPNRGNRPVNYVTWYDALRFANWLHNGQPTGAQDASTTEDGAYDMDLGAGVVREPGALFVLPTEDEWYKAAYYKGSGMDAGYWDYPTGSDDPDPPTSETPPGTDTTYGSANYYDNDWVDSEYYTTEVGAYSTESPPGTYVSAGPYGTFDQGGNIWEWNESEAMESGLRGLRGGSFGDPGYGADVLHASYRNAYDPTGEHCYIGFRVAEVTRSADTDHDGDVDLRDFAAFQACFGTVVSGCEALDFNDSGDVDLVDYDQFEERLAGPVE